MAVVRGGARCSGCLWGAGALRLGLPGLAAVVAVVAVVPASADAEPGMCHVVDVDFLPAEFAGSAPMQAASQIVAWVESPTGDYVDTVFITQQTGSFGLGNRPGRFDFNSGPRWPYGRRITVFPVWSHRRAASGLPTFPEVAFQNQDESNLSHPFNESSRELHFCRPLMSSESGWDTGTCASTVFTDKGVLGTRTSLYPPRNDVVRGTPDHPSVEMFQLLNPFDAVSHATPPSGVPAELSWPIPENLPMGDYVMWVEVSREFDRNVTYAYPQPSGIPWSEYGEPYRGQPSIVYKVPFSIGTTERAASVLDYLGYGDPDGLDGNIRPPDGTITTGVMGSGAERFSIRVDGATSYRVRVTARPEFDFVKPAAPTGAEINTLSSTAATVQFTAPGDDELVGKVKGYEIRYVVGPTLTEEAYPFAQELKPDITISEPGTIQEFEMTGLLYDTEYTIGIRALDDCRNAGPLTFVTFRTPDRATGEVDACFIATAAYGSVMANDVEMLRRFRDMLLQNTVLGELAVEAYYTFGPAVAGIVGESELLRATARAALDPLVHVVKVLRF